MSTRSRILAASAIVLGVIFPIFVSAATLSLSAPPSAIVGRTFSVSLLVSSTDEAINAVSSTLSFPPDYLNVESVSKTGSILQLWVQEPTFSNSAGTVDVSGLVPNPGWNGASGSIVTVTFRALKEGSANIGFGEASVLANDGNGTDILTASTPASIALEPSPSQSEIQPSVETSSSAPSPDLHAMITSTSHPDQTQWYALKHAVLDWSLGAGVTAVRLGADNNPSGQPAVLYSTPISHKEIELDDGVWYFHVQEKARGVWGDVATYTLHIDTQPPYDLGIDFPNGTTTSVNAIVVLLSAADDGSGVSRFELAGDGKVLSVPEGGASSTKVLVPAPGGSHTLIVTAFDRAGNSTEGQATFVSYAPEQSTAPPRATVDRSGWFIALGLAIAAALAFWLLFLSSSRRIPMLSPSGAEDVRRTVHTEFLELRQAIEEELARLERVQSRRDLSAAEAKIVKRFKLLLARSEASIDAEIEKSSDA